MNENDIQRCVFSHLRIRGVSGLVAFHPKNGGIHQRGRSRGINAGLGVLSGIPDVIAIKPAAGAILSAEVFALELKALKGKVSDEQRAVMDRLNAAGVRVSVTFGLNAALDQLEEWGLLKGKAA